MKEYVYYLPELDNFMLCTTRIKDRTLRLPVDQTTDGELIYINYQAVTIKYIGVV
jgi:hypothetical protein